MPSSGSKNVNCGSTDTVPHPDIFSPNSREKEKLGQKIHQKELDVFQNLFFRASCSIPIKHSYGMQFPKVSQQDPLSWLPTLLLSF